MTAVRPLRLLHVANGYPPLDVGGVESYTRALCRALAARGHEVRILCREDGGGARDGTWRDDRVDGLPVRRVANAFRDVAGFADYYHNTTIEDLFAETLVEWRPELVHFQHLIGLSASLPPRAAAMGVPAVWSLHDYWALCPIFTRLRPDNRVCPGSHHAVNCFECLYGVARPFGGRHYPPVPGAPATAPQHPFALREGTMHRLRRTLPRPLRRLLLAAYDAGTGLAGRLGAGRRRAEPIELPPAPVAFRAAFLRHALRSCRALVAPHELVRESYVDFGIEAERIRLIPLGMDLAAWAGRERVARPAPPPERPVRLGYFGSIRQAKGIDVLLDALRLVPTLDVELQLHGFFAAGDPLADELRDRIRAERRARLAGPYATTDLPELLGTIDVMVHPTRMPETFSFVAREAALAGVPVVASRLGALTTLIEDGVNGVLVPPDDPAAWAAAIARLVGDRDAIARMSAAQLRLTVKDIDTDAAELEALYAAVLARPTSGAAPERIADPPVAGQRDGSRTG